MLREPTVASPSEPGVEIFVREVRAARSNRGPLVLVHGDGPGGVASFDLPVPGYSLAADLASAGHTVDVMDVRGWAGGPGRRAIFACPRW